MLGSYKLTFTVLLCFVISGIIFYQLTRLRPKSKRKMSLRVEGLRANSAQFTLDGEPLRILGGSIHYFRVPRAYWEDRLLKLKACGLNTLTTYVPWNLHEPQRGVFNFNDQLDLESYIQLAADLGLWVILRPGPYICAEWDLGGLPSWLLQDKSMKLRTTYPGFTKAVNSFFDELIPKLLPYQFTKGGPIIAVQVENEYGSYAKDPEYMPFVKEALRFRGIQELLMTSDNQSGMKHGGVNGALETINLQRPKPEDIKYLDEIQPGKPKMVMEYWSGWFDLWGDLHHVFPAEDMTMVVTDILNREMSINLYMFHGGTNFGFMNGAFATGTSAPKPMVTSYDYDAPLSEAGDYTAKYHHLRDVFSRYHSDRLPAIPPVRGSSRSYQAVTAQQHLSLWDTLRFTEGPLKSEGSVNMENLPVNNGNGQSYGYALYETTIIGGGSLHSRDNIRDRALVFLDRQYIGTMDHKNQELALSDEKGERTLSLLVENCGRVNYGTLLDHQRKGLVGDIELNNTPLKHFLIHSLEMRQSFVNRLSSSPWSSAHPKSSFPGFFQARLHVDGPPKDTFLRLPGWGKGVVFVNGKNLGRYWSVGPQQTLYLPGPWLHNGDNKIVVFEEQETDGKIEFVDKPDLGMTKDVQ